MAIQVACACGRHFETGTDSAGRRASCPDCGRGLVVPRAGPSAWVVEPAAFEPLRFPTSGRATAGLVLGVLALACGALSGVPAVLAGCLALADIRKSRGRLRGRRA